MNCIIIEDEPLALERTAGYVRKLPMLNLVATFDNALEALPLLKAQDVDVLFLDINLSEFSGIQLLETTQISSRVIITTAYPEYALKGYDLNVADYLLKPFTFERFVQAIDKVQSKIQSGFPAKGLSPQKMFMFVKTEHRLEKVLFSELLYIEGMRDYRKIHLTGKTIMTLQTFGELEKEIPPNVACRVHKSYMVALDKIEAIERERITLKNAGSVIIPISETYKEMFFERIR
jgi:two-component system, LytTR family, response regulator